MSHILNLDAEIENKFEDDYNYKNIAIQDRPDFQLDSVLEDCFDFIDDGRHYGNVLVHCSGTIGLSRSTSICIAYLMNKEKQKFDVAFNNVKEVRSFVKPNDGFVKQLKDYEVKLRGAQQVKDSGIDDPFALRKKQEIEQEKAMVAGAASVKNRMKMFGATLDTGATRSKSVSPAPAKQQQPSTQTAPSSASSKWSSGAGAAADASSSSKSSISKSMTPEPRKSWHKANDDRSEGGWRKPTTTPATPTASAGPPPPPPPMPSSSLHGNDKSVRPLNGGSNKSSHLPPAAPPPPPNDLLKDSSPSKTSVQSTVKKFSSSQNERKSSISESGGDQKMVFGRRPPPPMKIRGGLSIERQDSVGDRNQSKASTT